MGSLIRLLKSMKFAIWLLLVLAVASLVSMFIVEFYPIDTGFHNWELIYSDKYGALFPVLKFFQLQDPYRSWWYQILLGILTLSLALCIIDRLPSNFRSAFRRAERFSAAQVSSFSNSAKFYLKGDAFDIIKRALRGYSVGHFQRDGKEYITADRNRINYLGPVFTHSGLLLLAIGGFVAIWGVSTRGTGFPGDMIVSDEFDFKVRIDDFRIEYYPLGVGQWVLVDGRNYGKIIKKLPDDRYRVMFYAHGASFSRDIDASRLENRFDIEVDRGNIKDYISELTIIEGDEEVLSRRVEVNEPMRYKGFRFYQSSFDTRNPRVSADVDSVVVQISRVDGGEIIDTVSLALDDEYPLPDGSSLVLSEFLPHFNIGPDGPVSASAKLLNPAVKATVFGEGEKLYHQWLFLLHDFHGEQEGAIYGFKLLDLINPSAEERYRTILEIKRNRGYEVIWLGLILASLGVFISFYFTPRHIRAVISPSDDGFEVVMGGYSASEREHFKEEFSRMLRKIGVD